MFNPRKFLKLNDVNICEIEAASEVRLLYRTFPVLLLQDLVNF